jgi:excisionase family DNA binding protein
MKSAITKCLTINEAAARLRVSDDKVRAMIRSGALRAIDPGLLVGRRQIRIQPEALAELEAKIVVRQPAPVRRRREVVDAEILALLGNEDD